MSKLTKNYTRVANGFLGMSSLWKGEDHLVYARGSGYLIPLTEEYKRYRFADIQSISVARRSRVGMAILYGLALLSFVGPLILILAFTDELEFGMGTAVAVSFFALGALLSFSLLLRHLILGPTCVCDIQTNLSRDRLRPLTRLHAAKQCMDSLGPQIRASQEFLEVEEADAHSVKPESGKIGSGFFTIPLPVIPTFVGVLLMGVFSLAALHLESVGMTSFLLLLILLVSFSLTFSLIASVRNLTPESVRSILWVTLGLLFVFLGASTVYLLIAAARNPDYTIDFMGPLEALTGIASGGGIGFYLVFLVASLGFLTCGLAGVLTSLRWKTRIKQVASARDSEPVERM